jgi:hypothetical protein
MKYVKALSSEELLKRLADELARMHEETAIDLGYWETAREVVERFYKIDVSVTVLSKKDEGLF